ncbi:polysaccharide biosynthesis protein [bacterium]|nr:polysaccharide biosynthesis protein [bacterium]
MNKTGGKKQIKLCIVCSGGGHLIESKLATMTLRYPKYYVTFYSPHHRHEKEKYYHVINPYRNLARFIINFWQSLIIFLKERPDIIITTGASVVISTCMIAKLFRKKVIFIESSGNPLTASATGRLLYRMSDLFYVQREQQKRFFPDARYMGSLL